MNFYFPHFLIHQCAARSRGWGELEGGGMYVQAFATESHCPSLANSANSIVLIPLYDCKTFEGGCDFDTVRSCNCIDTRTMRGHLEERSKIVQLCFKAVSCDATYKPTHWGLTRLDFTHTAESVSLLSTFTVKTPLDQSALRTRGAWREQQERGSTMVKLAEYQLSRIRLLVGGLPPWLLGRGGWSGHGSCCDANVKLQASSRKQQSKTTTKS